MLVFQLCLSVYTHIQCSTTCGGGTRSRNVSCVQFIAQINATTGEFICNPDGSPIGADVILLDGSCFMGNRPRSVDNCNTRIRCPHRWYPGAWQPVSGTTSAA